MPNDTPVRQFELTTPAEPDETDDPLYPCHRYLLVWLEDLPTLQPGVQLTLKETGDTLWTIRGAYHKNRPADDLHRPHSPQVVL